MISRAIRSLFFKNNLCYATQEKRNIVVIPKRYEVTFNQFNALETHINISRDCNSLAVLIKVHFTI